MSLNDLNNSMTDVRIKIDALKQIVSHIGKVKYQGKLKIEELRKKVRNISKENPFDFTGYFEKQKEDNEIDLSLFLEFAEENNIFYNQTPVNNLIEDLAKLQKWFFYERLFLF